MLPYVGARIIRSMGLRIRSWAIVVAEGDFLTLWGLPSLLQCPLFRTVGEIGKNKSARPIDFFMKRAILIEGCN